MKQLLNSFRRTWGLLIQFACWVAVAIGTFIPEPPLTTLTATPDVALRRFTQFLGAVIIGVFFIFCQKWRSRTHTKMWVMVTIIMAIVTVGAFFAERAVRPAWTCSYFGRVITIGSQLTSDAQKWKSTLAGEVTCDRLLGEYGGQAYQVWEKDGSERRYLLLSILMVIVWLGAASCIMSVTQAIRCSTAQTKSRKRKVARSSTEA